MANQKRGTYEILGYLRKLLVSFIGRSNEGHHFPFFFTLNGESLQLGFNFFIL